MPRDIGTIIFTLSCYVRLKQFQSYFVLATVNSEVMKPEALAPSHQRCRAMRNQVISGHIELLANFNEYVMGCNARDIC